jgi:hypothetical protein
MPRIRNLQTSRTSKHYHQQLREALVLFCSHCRTIGSSLVKVCSSPELANTVLIEYIQQLYARGQSLKLATHTVLGTQTAFRPLKGKLRGAWDSIASWSDEAPSKLRPALPEPLLWSMTLLARLWASEASGVEALEWWVMSALLPTGFYAVLRPCELLSLCPRKVSLPGGFTTECPFPIVAIIRPKNRRRLGHTQFAVARHHEVAPWLRWISAGLPLDTPFWTSSAGIFRRKFVDLTRSLGVGHLGFTPACLRAGGLTHFFQLGVDPSRLLFWARQSAPATLNHYLQEAVASLVLMQLPPESVDRIKLLLCKAAFLREPPPQPWCLLASRGRQLLLPPGKKRQ